MRTTLSPVREEASTTTGPQVVGEATALWYRWLVGALRSAREEAALRSELDFPHAPLTLEQLAPFWGPLTVEQLALLHTQLQTFEAEQVALFCEILLSSHIYFSLLRSSHASYVAMMEYVDEVIEADELTQAQEFEARQRAQFGEIESGTATTTTTTTTTTTSTTTTTTSTYHFDSVFLLSPATRLGLRRADV